MSMLAFILYRLIGIYIFIIIVAVVLSWLIGFNVINRHNRVVDSIWRACTALTEPALGPVRRLLPDFGGVDISPIIVIVVLEAINRFVVLPLIV